MLSNEGFSFGASMDRKLIALARSAEEGNHLPMVRLATAAQLIVGMPGPSSRYSEATWGSIRSEQLGQHGGGHQTEQEILAIRGGWTPVAREAEPEEPDVLTLYEAIAWAWGEPSGLRLPAIRVQLDAVTAWWVGPGEQLKNNTRSSFGVVGLVSVPIGS